MTSQPTVAVVHFPSPGHIRPMLPLAEALARQDLRVVQWAPAEWERQCLAAGGEFRALPELDDLAWPAPAPARIAQFLAGLAERLAPWMSEQLADAGADAVLRDSFAQYGRYAALATGTEDFVVPAMMAFHGGMWPRPRGLRAFAEDIRYARRLGASSRRLARSYGKPLGRPLEVFAGRHGSTTFVLTVPSLQLEPQRLDGEDIRYLGPIRGLGPVEAAEEPALAGAGEAQVVYVSLGTVFEERPAFFRDAASALAAPGRRMILSVGRLDPQELGALPEGVSAHAHVDQLAVLRRADLFVTHAGFNGVQEGLAAGVPLLMCPITFEQELNAQIVAERGAGLICADSSARSVAEGARLLLDDPSYRAAAQRLARELRAGSRLDEGVELVAQAARAHAGARTAGGASPTE